jgi:hypothetical protein
VRCKGFDRVMQLATLTTSISSFGLDIKAGTPYKLLYKLLYKLKSQVTP